MTSRMAYRREPQRIEYFSYHEWVDTPARMIASMIESRLDNIGLFGAVLSGSPDVRADLRLDSDVKVLVQEFDAGTSSSILTVKVGLVEIPSRSLLNSKTFSYGEPARRPDPEAGAIAANRAAERFLVDLASFLAESIQHIDCSPPN